MLMVYRTAQKTWSDIELDLRHENLIGWEAAALKYLNQSVLDNFFILPSRLFTWIAWLDEYSMNINPREVLDKF